MVSSNNLDCVERKEATKKENRGGMTTKWRQIALVLQNCSIFAYTLFRLYEEKTFSAPSELPDGSTGMG